MFGDYTPDVIIKLLELFDGIAPIPESKVCFTSAGSDSVETTDKIARRY